MNYLPLALPVVSLFGEQIGWSRGPARRMSPTTVCVIRGVS
jgi:hypothetical protein